MVHKINVEKQYYNCVPRMLDERGFTPLIVKASSCAPHADRSYYIVKVDRFSNSWIRTCLQWWYGRVLIWLGRDIKHRSKPTIIWYYSILLAFWVILKISIHFTEKTSMFDNVLLFSNILVYRTVNTTWIIICNTRTRTGCFW